MKKTKKVAKNEIAGFTSKFRALNRDIEYSFKIMDSILEDLKRK